MRNRMKKMITIMLLVGTMISALSTNAMAAYCGVSGSCKGATTFDVTTCVGVGQSVTVKPTTPGQLWICRNPEMYYQQSWADYKITIKRIKGSGYVPGTTYLYGKYSEKIWLGSNSTYRITVTPTTYKASDWRKTSFWELNTGIGIKSVVMR